MKRDLGDGHVVDVVHHEHGTPIELDRLERREEQIALLEGRDALVGGDGVGGGVARGAEHLDAMAGEAMGLVGGDPVGKPGRATGAADGWRRSRRGAREL